MSETKIESLTDRQLLRRKKFALIFIGFGFGVFLFCIVLLIVFVSKEQKNLAALVPGLVLPAFIAPMYTGVKRINAEIKKRQEG